MDKGSPFCYTASKKSYGMLDPYWIDGPAKHVKRSALRWLFILRRDKSSPRFVPLEVEEALRVLEQGESIGVQSEIRSTGIQPFYNPHLLLRTPERLESHRNFFRRLLENTRCTFFNSEVADASDILRIIQGEHPGS